jgi:hypothetical protein
MRTTLAIIAAASIASVAGAQSPRLGGPMKHISIGFDGVALHASVDQAVATPTMQDYAETYTGLPSVLNDKMYNAQYGWVIEGVWTLPDAASLWIEQTLPVDNLEVFGGRTMLNNASYTPIFGTAGSAPRIMWSGTMLHNWYATTVPGAYSATYRVYLGDASGEPLTAYQEAFVTLDWFAKSPCTADFDQNGIVNIDDIFVYLNAWFSGCLGSAGQPCNGRTVDADADNHVSIDDLFIFIANWFGGCD